MNLRAGGRLGQTGPPMAAPAPTAPILDAGPRLRRLLTAARRGQAAAQAARETWQTLRWRGRVTRILARPEAPDCARAEADFAALQGRVLYDPAGYSYEPHAVWSRGLARAGTLLGLAGQASQMRSLEAGCGDGLTSLLLWTHGWDTVLTDLEDWRHPRVRGLELHRAPLEDGLPLPDGGFDAVFSYNTFEHVRDPGRCLRELVRLLRPGGWMHLDFGPLYASPWGLHAYRTVRAPYAQFLFRREFVRGRLKELGFTDLGQAREELQPLNEWRLAQFDGLFSGCGLRVERRETLRLTGLLPMVLRYPECFRGRGLRFEDLVTANLRVTLRRPPAA